MNFCIRLSGHFLYSHSYMGTYQGIQERGLGHTNIQLYWILPDRLQSCYNNLFSPAVCGLLHIFDNTWS